MNRMLKDVQEVKEDKAIKRRTVTGDWKTWPRGLTNTICKRLKGNGRIMKHQVEEFA